MLPTFGVQEGTGQAVFLTTTMRGAGLEKLRLPKTQGLGFRG